jgi:hypothetical protein
VNTHKLAKLTPTGRLGMVRRLEQGTSLQAVAVALDLSVPTVRRWWPLPGGGAGGIG